MGWFVGKGNLTTNLKNWWHPPVQKRTKPTPAQYFGKRLFLWMPRKMWEVDFKCPHCTPTQSLRSKGLYNRVCLVLDLKDFYYLAGLCFVQYLQGVYAFMTCTCTYTCICNPLLNTLTCTCTVQCLYVHRYTC